jgi:hypothetical protein
MTQAAAINLIINRVENKMRINATGQEIVFMKGDQDGYNGKNENNAC